MEVDWVECEKCYRWYCLDCAGFESREQASSAEFQCPNGCPVDVDQSTDGERSLNKRNTKGKRKRESTGGRSKSTGKKKKRATARKSKDRQEVEHIPSHGDLSHEDGKFAALLSEARQYAQNVESGPVITRSSTEPALLKLLRTTHEIGDRVLPLLTARDHGRLCVALGLHRHEFVEIEQPHVSDNWMKEEDVPAPDAYDLRSRYAGVPPPSYPEMRKQLCAPDPSDPNYQPYKLTQLLFRRRFGPHALRTLWASHFAPSFIQLLQYLRYSPEMSDILMLLTANGENLVGVGLGVTKELLSDSALRDRVSALHRTHGSDYMRCGRDLVFSLAAFPDVEVKAQVWLDLRELLMVQWMGVLQGRNLAYADSMGVFGLEVSFDTIPGTFTITRIQIKYSTWRLCWVIILWALIYGVHVAHPVRDGCTFWVTRSLRLRLKSECLKERAYES